MAQTDQRGWLKKESRTHGETWVLFFRRTRQSDGKRVENKIPIGLVKDLPEKSLVWAEVERLHLPLNHVYSPRGVTFADLAQHYAEHELADHAESIHPKAHTTVRAYERVLRNRLLPRWGNRIALGGADIKVMQELLRHASTRVTLDTYTQAVTPRSERLKPRSSDSSFRMQRLLRKPSPKLGLRIAKESCAFLCLRVFERMAGSCWF
jgi:hypothetical protein